MQIAEHYRTWLRAATATPLQRKRRHCGVFSLHFALQMTTPETAPANVVKAAAAGSRNWFCRRHPAPPGA